MTICNHLKQMDKKNGNIKRNVDNAAMENIYVLVN